jgi:hypothetical protein
MTPNYAYNFNRTAVGLIRIYCMALLPNLANQPQINLSTIQSAINLPCYLMPIFLSLHFVRDSVQTP